MDVRSRAMGSEETSSNSSFLLHDVVVEPVVARLITSAFAKKQNELQQQRTQQNLISFLPFVHLPSPIKHHGSQECR
jgi:hypothetical protein